SSRRRGTAGLAWMLDPTDAWAEIPGNPCASPCPRLPRRLLPVGADVRRAGFSLVMPATAGIQGLRALEQLDPRLRGDDETGNLALSSTVTAFAGMASPRI